MSDRVATKRSIVGYNDEESDSDSEPVIRPKKIHRLCPYLDTINRHVLDFDFEKLCSVSLSRINVYACLVCGKYFQGRGTNTHAYLHSVGEGHHVFLNLLTLKFYCLPDNYEIIDSSLDDIKYVLNPTFTQENINVLDSSDKLSRAVDGTLYLPGIVGMNNIKANDYCNVVLQALSHVRPLRDYFLRAENYAKVKRPPGDSSFLLVQRFGELMRKLWNPRNFKAHVSPHEMLQAVVLWSRKKFQFTEQGDPIDFLSWFLNALHLALNGTKKPDSSIIYKSFLGSMRIYTRKIPPIELEDQQKAALLLTDEYQEKVTESPFLYLTCELPPPPLFKDEFMENIIPQVNLFTLLHKFNSVQEKEYKTYKENFLKRFELTVLPPYLILYIKRFTKNTFFVEKNPTIVNFPVKNVDLADIMGEEVRKKHRHTTYELMANIVHDGDPCRGTYRVHLLHKSNGKWYELQDLHVTDILPQMITLTEAYIQIYELNTAVENPFYDPNINLELVESIPIGVTYDTNIRSKSTTAGWKELITTANRSIDIASLYWTLQGKDVVPDDSASQGEEIFDLLKSKATILRVSTNAVSPPDADTEELKTLGAQVRQVNMTQLVGAGVLHTKLILVDGAHFYLGSANMDWRSLTQVKELGVLGTNCPCLANDLQKIFSVYWIVGEAQKIPPVWPTELATMYNLINTARINVEGAVEVYISSSPPQFSTLGRTNDIDAIVNTIRRASSYVYIAVMDYFPMFLYSTRMKFWPEIDNELRRAYINRGVNIKLLVSKWAHTRKTMEPYLKSLQSLNGLRKNATIEVKWFQVPTNSSLDKIPFARVNHNKYMVTDLTALIGTSNWSADYFTNTGGISLVLHQDSPIGFRNNLTEIFKRDWFSGYTRNIK